jgi:hypothetical protein
VLDDLKMNNKSVLQQITKCTAANERFGAMSAVPRRQFCGNLDVITPQQVQWKPPLRQAAGTLSASGGQRSAIGKRKMQNVADNDSEI